MDWNDTRYFLAVARHGSTLSAGKALRVSQTTVARRIAALEQALDLRLYDRRQGGYALTAEGERLLAWAEGIEAAALAFEQAAVAQAREIAGVVRITTDEIIATGLLPDLLATLRESHPRIVIEVDGSEDVRDLARGEADIALRSTCAEHIPGLVGRRICSADWALYCSAAYAEKNGVPRSLKALKDHVIVGGGGGHLWRSYQAWLRLVRLEGKIALHHASSIGLLSAVRSGYGIAVLPCIVADGDPALVRCMPPNQDHGRTLWLLVHERLRTDPRIRAVLDTLFEGLTRHVSTIRARQEQLS